MTYILWPTFWSLIRRASDSMGSTCASPPLEVIEPPKDAEGPGGFSTASLPRAARPVVQSVPQFKTRRSEERRVGKEWESRWPAGHYGRRRAVPWDGARLAGRT